MYDEVLGIGHVVAWESGVVVQGRSPGWPGGGCVASAGVSLFALRCGWGALDG